MENFESPHNKVKEKSLYVMHLDTVRIVLISAAVIGVVVVSFLLGMNFMRQGGGEPAIADNAEMQKDLDILKNTVPPQEEDLAKAGDTKDEPGGKDTGRVEGTAGDGIAKNETVDLLNSDGAGKAVEPVKKRLAERKPAEKKIVKEKKTAKAAVVSKKDISRGHSPVQKKSKKRIVEVAGDEFEGGKGVQAERYSIQIGSLDNRERAMAQVKALKERHYNARLDRTTVDGKKVYRVKIGPMAQKKKAIATLKKLQQNEEYDESFIVKE